MMQLIRELYPLTRSITGEGVRQSLRKLGQVAPIRLHEVPTGTRVLDWEVPREWNIRDAWIKDPSGRRVVDFRQHNLHVMSYSVPVRRQMSLAELRPYLHSDPSRPNWIPYRTSYYAENWGFCLTHEQLMALPDNDYEVVIDSTLAPGSLTYGECVIPGQSEREILFYTHTCHPSLCNDNLTGMVVCAYLAQWLARRQNYFRYRLVFGPGTIGSITWLAKHPEVIPNIANGLVVALVGTRAPLRYKMSFGGRATIDRAVSAFLGNEEPGAETVGFSPWGYDERQFGSPGFRLPVGRLTRAGEEGYPEYHTSGDGLDLVDEDSLVGALRACQQIVTLLEANYIYRSTAPYGEPQLGRRGLYRAVGGPASAELQRAMLWVLNLADGSHDLVEVYRHSRVRLEILEKAVRLLSEAGLLERVAGPV